MTGLAVLEYLVSIGYTKKVKCIVRSSSDLSKHDHIKIPIEYIECDLECLVDMSHNQGEEIINPLNAIIDKALIDVDVILHIASIKYSKAIIELAKKHEVKRVVLVHTALMYSKYYKYAKNYQRIEGEIIVEKGVNFTILRPTVLYGNQQDNLIHHIFEGLTQRKVYVIQGIYDVYYQPTYVGDLVQAIFGVIDNEDCYYETFLLSGQEATRYIDMVKMIRKILKTRNLILRIPFYLVNMKLRVEAIRNHEEKPSYKELKRQTEDRRFAHGKATEYFGYAPITLYEGLIKQCDSYKLGQVKQ